MGVLFSMCYYHRNHQGSIVALTDTSGSVVESYTYDAYGQTNTTGSINTGNLYAYTGREFDDSDLYYYRARYYDPTVKVFLSEDPIGFISGDYNLYRYVTGNPVNFIDPDGLRPRGTGRGGLNPYGGYPGNPYNAPRMGSPRGENPWRNPPQHTEPAPNSPIRPRKGQNPKEFWRDFYRNPLFDPTLDPTGPPGYYDPDPFYDPFKRPGKCEA